MHAEGLLWYTKSVSHFTVVSSLDTPYSFLLIIEFKETFTHYCLPVMQRIRNTQLKPGIEPCPFCLSTVGQGAEYKLVVVPQPDFFYRLNPDLRYPYFAPGRFPEITCKDTWISLMGHDISIRRILVIEVSVSAFWPSNSLCCISFSITYHR